MSVLSPQNIRAIELFARSAGQTPRSAMTHCGTAEMTINGPIQKNECGRCALYHT
jgi:hypothetical protein